MNPSQALNLLKQSAEKFLGTLEDHLKLQEAVRALEDLVAKHENPPTPATPATPGVPAASVEPDVPVEPEA